MRKRSATVRGSVPPPGLSEVEGFLEGVRHRLRSRREAGLAVPDLERRLVSAEASLSASDLTRTERILLEISGRLDEDEEEPELSEFPRGLIAYDAGTDRGVPTPEEEEPIANRLRIVDRLLAVAAAEGLAVDELRTLLGRARGAYDGGDRRQAKELGEQVLALLDERRRSREPI